MTVNLGSFSIVKSVRALSTESVDSMMLSIDNAFAIRDNFETRDGEIVAGKAYRDVRKKMIANKRNVACLFLVSGVTDASNVICRKLVETNMFSAYALVKMNEIADLVCGAPNHKMQAVTRAFLACAIVATDNGATVIDNVDNALFLKRDALKASSYFKDDEKAFDMMTRWARGHCENSEQTQSSQVRCVLEALNFATLVHDKRSRGAIAIDTSHAFIKLFRGAYMKGEEIAA
jgi:hypothetical protein